MKEKLPIKFFAKREEDKQRVEGGGKKELPKFVLSGSELNEKSAELSRMIFDALEEDWEDRNIPVIIEAKLNKDAHAKKIVQRILNGTDKDKLLETVVQLETEQQFQAI